MKFLLGFILGAIIALLLAISFWFDSIELEYSKIILEEGFSPNFFLKTETFKKSLISIISGGIIGTLVTAFSSKKNN